MVRRHTTAVRAGHVGWRRVTLLHNVSIAIGSRMWHSKALARLKVPQPAMRTIRILRDTLSTSDDKMGSHSSLWEQALNDSASWLPPYEDHRTAVHFG